VVSFTPQALYLGEVAPGTRWTGGCVSPTTTVNETITQML